MNTPLYELTAKFGENRLFIKRDDLYPRAFGGNKARIALEYIEDMLTKNCNCMVGYGNSRSNLNRALALLSSERCIPFHAISPCDDDGKDIETFNSKLAVINGASFHKCTKTNVANTVEMVLKELRSQGLNPYYINGNIYGTGNEEVPVRAYAKTYYEILEQAKLFGVNFDYIFLAIGTGMTLAGLLSSQAQNEGKEKIIGISVARDKKTAKQVVQRYCAQYCKEPMKKVKQNKIRVIDDYRCGGYGKSSPEEIDMMSKVLNHYGIPLDPTYTGKAFWGMTKFLQEQRVCGSNVLFIHTGGTPLFYDWISKEMD